MNGTQHTVKNQSASSSTATHIHCHKLIQCVSKWIKLASTPFISVSVEKDNGCFSHIKQEQEEARAKTKAMA